MIFFIRLILNYSNICTKVMCGTIHIRVRLLTLEKRGYERMGKLKLGECSKIF